MLPAEIAAYLVGHPELNPAFAAYRAYSANPVWLNEGRDASAAALAAGIARLNPRWAGVQLEHRDMPWGEGKEFYQGQEVTDMLNPAWLAFIQKWNAEHGQAATTGGRAAPGPARPVPGPGHQAGGRQDPGDLGEIPAIPGNWAHAISAYRDPEIRINFGDADGGQSPLENLIRGISTDQIPWQLASRPRLNSAIGAELIRRIRRWRGR